MRRSTQRVLWVGGLLLGAVATASIVIVATAKPANASSGSGGALGDAKVTALVTDPNNVAQVQSLINLMAKSNPSMTAGPTDGDPTNEVFKIALANNQAYLNALNDFRKAGLPFDRLRADGVLDNATAAALLARAIGMGLVPRGKVL
jgi:hypothetical protein